MSARDLIARACCRDPDECVMGAGSISTAGTSSFECYQRAWEQQLPRANAILSDLTAAGYRLIGPTKFDIGQRVTKIKGSSWTGKVVGFYSTSLTPMGYAVESENEPGSVQVYPEAALRSLQGGDDGR